jgi:hypothetical protein
MQLTKTLLLVCIAALESFGAACSPSLAPFADSTLHIATVQDCSGPPEVPVLVELRPVSGASDDDCPTMDASARIFVDDREADVFDRGGSRVTFFAPEGIGVPFDHCAFVRAEGLLSPPDGEHEVRIVLGDATIAATVIVPDGMLSCEGVAECVLEIEAELSCG